MRVLIIGGGAAGVTAAKTLFEKDNNNEIVIINSEKYMYYYRPRLPDIIAGRVQRDDIIPYKSDWYETRLIDLKLETKIENIDLKRKSVITNSNKVYKYDKLILANGSESFIPPIPGTDKKGVYTVRTMEDALSIREYAEKCESAVVIGGGVLGLEIASALSFTGLKVHVLERSDWLMKRQLDKASGKLLASLLKEQNISLITNAETKAILGNNSVEGVRLTNNQVIRTQMVIITAGVRCNSSIPIQAGIKVNRGVVVNDSMMTDCDDVYAIGDIAEHNGITYGIMPAALEQSRHAAANILGIKSLYKGTTSVFTLKVAGIFLTSLGVVNPQDNSKEFTQVNKNVYKKLVLNNGKLIGMISLGERVNARAISQIIEKGINIEENVNSILNGIIEPTMLQAN